MLVTARQIAMYLCRELTDLSLPKIGAQFGGRDHTTVMHADRKISQLLAERRAIYNQVTELTNRIKSCAPAAAPYRVPGAAVAVDHRHRGDRLSTALGTPELSRYSPQAGRRTLTVSAPAQRGVDLWVTAIHRLWTRAVVHRRPSGVVHRSPTGWAVVHSDAASPQLVHCSATKLPSSLGGVKAVTPSGGFAWGEPGYSWGRAGDNPGRLCTGCAQLPASTATPGYPPVSAHSPCGQKTGLTCAGTGYPQYPQPLLLRLHVENGEPASKRVLCTTRPDRPADRAAA